MFRAVAARVFDELEAEAEAEQGEIDGYEEPIFEDVFEASHTASRASAVKRTICKFWEEGACKNGANCTWAHGAEEVGMPVSPPEEATAMMGPNAKKTICKFWLQGTCTKGLSCTFAHGEEERVGAPAAPGRMWQGLMQRRSAAAPQALPQALPRAVPRPVPRVVPPGPWRNPAPAAPPVAGNTKRTICKFWEQGLCTKGDDCTFAHGEEEIGAPMIESTWPVEVTGPAVPFGGPALPFGGADAAFAGPVGANTKRTICRFWEQGTCTRGSECTWAHGEEEIGAPVLEAARSDGFPMPAKGKGREAPTPMRSFSAPGSHFGVSKVFTSSPFQDVGKGQAGIAPSWNGGKGVAEQPLKKTICKFWLEGQCSRGTECTWAHGEEDRMAVVPPPVASPWVAKGGGKPPQKGGMVALQQEAPVLRRSICKFWEQGKCSQAAGQCTWAHGEWEIGTAVGTSGRARSYQGYQGYQASAKRPRLA